MHASKIFTLQNKFIFNSLINLVIPLTLIIGLSYAKSVQLIERHVSQSNFNTVEQIADNIDFVFQDMKNTSVFLLQNREFINYLRLSDYEVATNPSYLLSTQHFINSYLTFNANIHSIYLESFNGLEFDSESAQNTINDGLREQLRLLRGEGILIPDVITNYNRTCTRVFSFIKIIKDPDNLSLDLAILKINIAEEDIANVFKSKLLSENSRSFIIDKNGIIISSTDKTEIDMPLPPELNDGQMYRNKKGYYNDDISSEEFVVTYCDLSSSGWKLVNLTLLSDLSQDILVVRNITLLAVSVSVLFCIIAIAYFAIKVLGPMRALRKAMAHLENENFNVNLPVHGKDEIALLATGFNKMSKKMGELINEVLAVQIKQKEAEIKALHAQINPHFLYNTMDMIYWTCRLEDAEESALLVKSLSKLFRLTLSSGNEITSLSKEIEHLELYLTLQKKRFDGSVQFFIKVSDDIMDCRVVKLILQPLVENAVLHGIEKNGGSGNININIYQDNGTLVYVIQDDGAGAVEDEVYAYLDKVDLENRGFALNNVNARIKIHYGQDYGIAFKTAPGEGMIVTVTQPIIQNTVLD